MRELIILTHVPTDSVNDGFIPAAQRLDLSIVLLTAHAGGAQRQEIAPNESVGVKGKERSFEGF